MTEKAEWKIYYTSMRQNHFLIMLHSKCLSQLHITLDIHTIIILHIYIIVWIIEYKKCE